MEEWMEQYIGLHDAEGYHFAASSAIYFPYYDFRLVCKCLKYQQLTSLDMVILKCIKRGIMDVEGISFVLALNKEIIQEILHHMEVMGMLCLSEGKYQLTDNGNGMFQKQVKQSVSEQDFTIYINAVTGEIENGALSFFTGDISEETIQMEPDVFPDTEQIEKSNEIKEMLEKMASVKILDMKMQKYKKISYLERFILFYSNQEGKLKFDIYNLENHEFDIRMSTILLQKYQRKKLYSLMKVEKLVKTEKHFIGQYGKNIQLQYYRNREIRELFKNVFFTAQESILIVSPWIDNQEYVMTKELQNKMEIALRDRGIELTIAYGYLQKEKMQKILQEYKEGKRACDKDINTELMAENLRKRFWKYPKFHMEYIGTHEKILSYDERYTVIGSFNYLSYDGGEKYKYKGNGFRFEGGVFIDDREFACYVNKEILG